METLNKKLDPELDPELDEWDLWFKGLVAVAIDFDCGTIFYWNQRSRKPRSANFPDKSFAPFCPGNSNPPVFYHILKPAKIA